MVSNAVTKVELYGVNDAGDVRGFICASGTKIAKGTILKFSTARLAAAADGAADIFAGVASADKAEGDATVRVGCWENGILEFFASGTVTAGEKVVTHGTANMIRVATSAEIASTNHVIVGVAYKTVTNARTQVRVDN